MAVLARSSAARGHDDHRGSAGLDHSVVQGDGLVAADDLVHGDDAVRAGCGHAAAHLGRREAVRDGHHAGSCPDDGQVDSHALQGQGHVEGDGPVGRQAPVDETVGEAVDEAFQFAVGDRGEGVVILAGLEDGWMIGVGSEAAVDDVHSAPGSHRGWRTPPTMSRIVSGGRVNTTPSRWRVWVQKAGRSRTDQAWKSS